MTDRDPYELNAPNPLSGKVRDYFVENPTVPAAKFYAEELRLMYLNGFLWGAILIAQHQISPSKEFLVQLIEENQDELELDFDPEDPVNDFVLGSFGDLVENVISPETHKTVLSQMSFARLVENFQVYLQEIIMEVVESEPRVLNSNGRRETHKFIFSFDSIDELHEAIARERVRKLSYGGVSEFASFFEDRLGADLFRSGDERTQVERLVAIRNQIVHNRGRADERFVENWEDSDCDEGELLELSMEDFYDTMVLNRVVARADRHLADKFDLTPVMESEEEIEGLGYPFSQQKRVDFPD